MSNDHIALQPEDIDYLARARDWVKGHFTDHRDEKYSSIDGKLRVLRAILESDWVQPHEIQKLRYLGVAFGDAVAQKLMLEWVIVDDEYGRSPALNWPGTSILVFPVTMIAKRVEDGKSIDIEDLFEILCERVAEMAFSGESS